MKFQAWAIDTRSEEGHGFIGRYWTYWPRGGVVRPIPDHLEGCQIALFRTRRLARLAAKELREEPYSFFPEAQAVRVTVEVKKK